MTRRRAQLALLLALAPLVAACGSVGSRSGRPADPVARAATKTGSEQSMRVAFSGSISGPWAGQNVRFSGSGVVDGTAGAGRMHLRFTFPPAARAQLGASPSMDMVFRSRPRLVMYMRSPLLRAQLPDAKPWLKLDLLKLARLRGVDLRSLAQLNRTNPMENLSVLESAATSRELNWDQVRGELMKHYALTIDLKRLGRRDRQMQKALAQLRRLVGPRLPVEAWVDDRGYVRKLALKFSVAKSPDGPVRMRMSEEFFAFGVRAQVAPPPASQVTDATDLLTNRS